MKRILPAIIAIAILFVGLAPAAYYLSENLYTPTWSNWVVSGTMTPVWYAAGGYGGLTSGSSNGMMLRNGTLECGGEVKLTIRKDGSSHGDFSNILAWNRGDIGTQDSYYAVEFTDWGQVSVIQSKSYSSTVLTSFNTAINDGSTVRAVLKSDGYIGAYIILYVDDVQIWNHHQTSDINDVCGTNGLAVNSVPSGGGGTLLSNVDLAHLDTTAPNAIPLSSINHFAFTNYIDLSWPPASDNSGGSGVYGYQILRDGALLTTTTTTSYRDSLVDPDRTYNYVLRVVDYHMNGADTTFSVSTPNIGTNPPFPSATPEGMRIGIHPTGAYWGGGGENIDVRSGNLNYVLPLLKAQMRGTAVGFNLVYNSQNWREDSGGAWNFGADVGYGFGWDLLAGSITPVWNPGNLTAAYYLFTDSTGAQYRLDQNSSNVWSSKESVYVYFDANSNVLHFRDGTFWYFGCVSASNEADSGVLHPTLMEDTNGNQLL